MIQELGRRPNRRYDAAEITYFAIIDSDILPPGVRNSTMGSSIEIVRRLFDQLLRRVAQNLNPHDLVPFILSNDTLDRPMSTHLRRVSDMTVDIMDAVTKVLQSKDEIRLDAGF